MDNSNRQGLSSVALASYEWNDEFVKGQPQAYRIQNIPFVTARLHGAPEGHPVRTTSPRTVDELIEAFLSVLDDSEMPHGPSRYQILELQAFCPPDSLDTLEQGTDAAVTYALALLEDRFRLSSQAFQETAGGQRRDGAGPLSSARLLRELRKKRYECDNEPNAGRRLLYITNPDSWAIMTLALTASRDQALFLADFFYKYLGYKTSLGIHRPRSGIPLFALEFHLQFHVWREGDSLLEDSRKKRNGKPLRRSRELQSLEFEDHSDGAVPSNIYIHEAQISCLVTGLDHDSWIAYLFVDTYYQGASSCESVDYYHSRHNTPFPPDPLAAGTQVANLPIWEPREYFLTVYECRLEQMKHALRNLVSRLLLKLEPYLQDPMSLLPRFDSEGSLSFERKKQVQQMLNEASRLLRQTMHSICEAIEVWDRFSNRDAAYLSDILKPRRSNTDAVPPFRVVAMIGDHINDLTELKRRTEQQQDLCEGLARELELQLVMEDNESTNKQRETGELVKSLTVFGLLFLPFTATAALFSMQPGILPPEVYSLKIFLICWASLTFLVMLMFALHTRSPFRARSRMRRHSSQNRFTPSWHRHTSLASTNYMDSETAQERYNAVSDDDGIELGLVQSPRGILDQST